MFKHTLTIAILAATTLTTFGQTAREVLDATAARMTRDGAVKATFRATQFQGTTPSEETSGSMLIDGRKFHLQTNDLQAWFDGKQQWSMLANTNEANLTEPTEAELASTNPAMLIGIYKHGYTAKLSHGTLRGKPTYVVHLHATSGSAEFSDIVIDTERATYIPLCIRAKQRGNWVRLAILSFQSHQKAKATDFQFPVKQYPDVEVIDLR